MAQSPQKENKIQICYVNRFSSIWEYNRHFEGKAIDFTAILSEVCPICQCVCGYRPISPYDREVIDIVSGKRGRLLIGRWQCQKEWLTFSLLPHQLAPYHRYTIASMFYTLLLAHDGYQAPQGQLMMVFETLPVQLALHPSSIYLWLSLVLAACRRAHATLCCQVNLSAIRSSPATDKRAQCAEVAAYVDACTSRAPPLAPLHEGAEALWGTYCRLTQSFFLGTPSQCRGGFGGNV